VPSAAPRSRWPLAAGIMPANAQDLQTTSAGSMPPVPVFVIVHVPKPWYVPKAMVVGKMRDTIPDYAKRSGLMFKAFSFERNSGDFGGLYLWRDKASAEAWFNPAWFERVRKERRADAQVRMLDATVSVDNTGGGTLADSDSRAVGTLVEIPVPAGVTRERLAMEFNAAVPTYQKVQGLLRKHFTIASNGTFGGVYLWKDEASARAWFSDAWHARVVTHLGGFRRQTAFTTRVFQIARNHLLTASTRSRESPEVSLEAIGERLQQGLVLGASLGDPQGNARTLSPRTGWRPSSWHWAARRTC
jgi:hypothetical protein